jgi:carbonic anhydrase
VTAASGPGSADPFADIIEGNAAHAAAYVPPGGSGVARRRLAVLTCMDSRIDPLAMLGLRPGDAKILRNAGARVTDDVLRAFVLSAYLLDVARVMLVAHTGCRMAAEEADVHRAIEAAGGPDTRSLTFLTAPDQEAVLRSDVQRVRSWPYLPPVDVGGFIYDLDTGLLRRVS